MPKVTTEPRLESEFSYYSLDSAGFCAPFLQPEGC